MDWKNKSVLFVDDEESILNSLRRVLIDEPYEVRFHSDPKKALMEVELKPPDVVVADYLMPQMVGPELLKRVQALNGGIVRIILTGKADLFKILRAVNEGHVYRFMLKPWDEEELKIVLRNAIDYADLSRERDHLMVEMDKQRGTLEALERQHPGITQLPEQDVAGAYILTEQDLPDKVS